MKFDEAMLEFAPALLTVPLAERFMASWGDAEKSREEAAVFFDPLQNNKMWLEIYRELERKERFEINTIKAKYIEMTAALASPNEDWALISQERAHAEGMIFDKHQWFKVGKAYDEFLRGCEVHYNGGWPPDFVPRAWLRKYKPAVDAAALMRVEKAEAELRAAKAALGV